MNRTICRILSVMVIGTAAALAFADTESFDQVRPGALPPGWACGVTGRGSPHWAVEIDSSAPSKPNGAAHNKIAQALKPSAILRGEFDCGDTIKFPAYRPK